MPKANFSAAISLMDEAILAALQEYSEQPVTLVCTSHPGLAQMGINLYHGKKAVFFDRNENDASKAISSLVEARVLMSGQVMFNLGNSA